MVLKATIWWMKLPPLAWLKGFRNLWNLVEILVTYVFLTLARFGASSMNLCELRLSISSLVYWNARQQPPYPCLHFGWLAWIRVPPNISLSDLRTTWQRARLEATCQEWELSACRYLHSCSHRQIGQIRFQPQILHYFDSGSDSHSNNNSNNLWYFFIIGIFFT